MSKSGCWLNEPILGTPFKQAAKAARSGRNISLLFSME